MAGLKAGIDAAIGDFLVGTRGMFTDCYCTQFRRSANTLTSIYDEALRPIGLKITQFTLLRSLERLGAATYNEVAADVVLDKTTISRNLKVLISAGWASAGAAPGSDARFKHVRLTDEGARVLRNAEPYWRNAQRRVEEDMQQFLNGPANKQLLEALESLQGVGK